MSEANELRNPVNQTPERKGVTDILGDAVHSALYSAVQEPISGVTQIVDEFTGTKLLPKVQFLEAPKAAQFGTADWHAQQVGSAVGMLVPFLLVHKGVKGALGTSSAEAGLMSRKATFGMSMKEAGLTGFTYDAFLRPSDPNHANGMGGFLTDRFTQGAIGAGTFMTLTGAGLGLNKFASSAAIEKSALVPILKNPITNGVLSGVPAGLFAAEAHSLTKTGHLASASELGQSVYGMSLIGGGFGAVHSFTAPRENGAPSRFESIKNSITDTLSTKPGERRLGQSLLGGDKEGPDGVNHSVSPPEGNVTGNKGVEPEKVATPEVDAVLDPTKAGEPVVEPFEPATLEQLEALAARFNGDRPTNRERNRGKNKSGETETPPTETGSKPGEQPVVEATETGTKTGDPPVVEATETGTKTGDPPVVETPELISRTGDDASKLIDVPENVGVVDATTPAITSTEGTGRPTIDMLPKVEEAPVIINPELRDATADSAVAPAGDAVPAGKRRVRVPEVENARHADLVEGMTQLNNVLKSADLARIANEKAILAELRARDPMAEKAVLDEKDAARAEAVRLTEEADKARTDFTEFVESKGEGLQQHLETVAEQLKYPEKALEIVRQDFAIKEGRDLLVSATADGATYEQQVAFDNFVREKGQTIRPELERLGAEQKNADVARALIEKAYNPREINVDVEPGQQAAMNVGARVLTAEGGIDAVALKKYASDYGPAMEKHLLTAAEQLGFGVDAKIKIGEAYHGEAFAKGAELLRTSPMDVEAVKQFAENEGKPLEKQMSQLAVELGLDANAQLAVREAYRGVESWVTVQKADGTSGGLVPVKPEQEMQFRTLVSVLEQVAADSKAPPSHIEIVRQMLSSPDSAGLAEPLTHYAELSGNAHVQALLREGLFPKENWQVSGKPDVIPISDLFPEGPVGIEMRRRAQDLGDLLTALKEAPMEEVGQRRYDVMDWLTRNSDMYDVARRIGENTSDSRVAAVVDSFFGTNNLEPFMAAKEKYDQVAAEITPQLIERMNKPGHELFWELAPPAAKEPRMWGGSENIGQSKQALRTRTLEDGSVVAEFNAERHPERVSKVTDSPDGKRTIDYADGSQFIQMPEGYNLEVQPDGSWRSTFSNGNYLIEYAETHPGNVAKIVYENGKATTLYRDGRVEHAGVENQTAWKNNDGTVPKVDAPVQEKSETNLGPGVRTRAQVTELVNKLSSSDYNEAAVAAVQLKNSFGQMTDTQFVQWLNFAMGQHPDTFGGSGRMLPNWPDLHLRDGGQVLFQDNLQSLLRGGDTPAEQQSEAGQTRAFQARQMLREYFNAPEGRPSDLQFPGWLVKANQLPPESLPQNVLKDIRARFGSEQLPPDVAEYLAKNPEKPPPKREGDDRRGPWRPFELPSDTLPARLRTLSDVLQYAPKEIQQTLIQLGAKDARALKDVMQVLTPRRSARDKAQPPEFEELLKLTVPQARDIYTVKMLIQAVRDANWASQKNPTAFDANLQVAMKAAQQLLPDNVRGQNRVIDLVNGLANGQYRAPFVPRDEEFQPPSQPEVGRYEGEITRQEGLRLDEEYPMEEPRPEVYTQEPLPDEYPDSPLNGGAANHPARDFELPDWEAERPAIMDRNAYLDGNESASSVNNALDTGEIG